jgi:hypothetical protein
MSDVVNPPYEPPFGHADAPPPVPPDPNLDPEAQAYLDAFVAPPDPRDPVEGEAGAARNPEDYQDAFVKPPDPRDPEDSELTPGDLTPPAPGDEGSASAPPVVVDIPNLSQEGATLNCTMGNWQGEPTSYAYQWQAEGVDVGDGTATYALIETDVGLAFVCVVSATNAAGTTVAPPSNMVTATEIAVREASHKGRRHKSDDKSEDPF